MKKAASKGQLFLLFIADEEASAKQGGMEKLTGGFALSPLGEGWEGGHRIYHIPIVIRIFTEQNQIYGG
jgi:hypothetical protein